jgi:predicted nucleic acid-binding Zn ribbon protein
MATLTYVGRSSDARTNRWAVVCDCGKRFEPVTTMYATQTVVCPKCNAELFCDYNAEPATIKKVG